MDRKELANCLEKKEKKKTMLNALLRYEKALLDRSCTDIKKRK